VNSDSIKKYFTRKEVLLPLKIKYIKKINVTEIGKGQNNRNFMISINKKNFVLRINIDPDDPEKTDREFIILNALKNTLIAPIPYYKDTTKKYFNNTLMVTSFIKGRPLIKKDHRTIKNIAKLLAKVHTINPEEIGGIIHLNNKNKYSDPMKIINNRIIIIKKEQILRRDINVLKQILTEKYAPKDKLKQLVHGNFWLGNILVDNKEYKLVDFENTTFNDPAIDLAHTLEDFGFTFNQLEEQELIEEYIKETNDLDIKKRLEIYRTLDRVNSFLRQTQFYLNIKNKHFDKLVLLQYPEKKEFKKLIEYNEKLHVYKDIYVQTTKILRNCKRIV
jgi:thiamine kinase-like enzyme